MFDSEFFLHVSIHLLEQPHAGLNGHGKKLCEELRKIGECREEFIASVPLHERNLIARAVQQAFELDGIPGDTRTFKYVRQLIKHSGEVGYDRLWRGRLLSFTSYISTLSS